MPSFEHDGNGIYLGAAFAFMFDERGRFLLLEERPERRKYMYDLPGGTLGPAEDPIDGLRREVREETGLSLDLASPLCYLKWDSHESGYPILVAFYVARMTGVHTAVETSSEHSGYRWVTPTEYREEALEVSLANQHVESLLQIYERDARRC